MTPERKIDFIRYWLKETYNVQYAEWEWDLDQEILSLYDEDDFLLEEYTWTDIIKVFN